MTFYNSNKNIVVKLFYILNRVGKDYMIIQTIFLYLEIKMKKIFLNTLKNEFCKLAHLKHSHEVMLQFSLEPKWRC